MSWGQGEKGTKREQKRRPVDETLFPLNKSGGGQTATYGVNGKREGEKGGGEVTGVRYEMTITKLGSPKKGGDCRGKFQTFIQKRGGQKKD